MIDEHCSIPQRKPGEATRGERPLLMGREEPHRRPGDAALEREKERLAVREGEGHQGIRLTSTLLEVKQRQEGIQDGAHDDQERERHSRARQTIDIPLASLPSPPKACAPALPAERTPERRGVRSAIRELAPVERLTMRGIGHSRPCLPTVIPG